MKKGRNPSKKDNEILSSKEIKEEEAEEAEDILERKEADKIVK